MAARTQGLFSLATRKPPKKILRLVRAAAERLCAYLVGDTSADVLPRAAQDDELASSSSKAAQLSRDPEADVREKRMWGTLNAADSLTRDVFVLHRIYGYSHAHIASQLRMSLQDVEERVACIVVMISIERQEPARD